MIVFPIIKSKRELADGSLVQVPDVCKKEYSRSKCEKYYENIEREKISGVVQCPKGFCTISESGKIIATCLKIKGYYDKTKTKNRSNDAVFDRDFVQSILSTVNKLNEDKKKNDELKSDLIDIYHDIRKLNSVIINRSTELNYACKNQDDNFDDTSMYKLRNIFASSSMIRINLDSFQLEYNPAFVTQKKTEIPVFKRFEKATHVINALRNRNTIKLMGESRSLHFGYEIFDLLPFILIDNAVKYAPNSQDVEIYFEEKNSVIKVKVISLGPEVQPQELLNVYEKFFRCTSAKNFDGSGRGLFLAKRICDLNDISINVNWVSKSINLNKMQYGDFIVELSIPTISLPFA